MKKITGPDAGQLYAMKVLKKATLKGTLVCGDNKKKYGEFVDIEYIMLAMVLKLLYNYSIYVFC